MLKVEKHALGGAKIVMEINSYYDFSEEELEDFFVLIANRATEDPKHDHYSQIFFLFGDEELSILTNYHDNCKQTVDVTYLKNGKFGRKDLISSNIGYMNIVGLFKMIYNILLLKDFEAPFEAAMGY